MRWLSSLGSTLSIWCDVGGKGVRMRLLKAIYEKTHSKPAPYYYNYSIGTILFKPIRKWLTNTVAANCPFNCIRIAIYRMCGFKIGKGTFIGMKCYLDDMGGICLLQCNDWGMYSGQPVRSRKFDSCWCSMQNYPSCRQFKYEVSA